MNCHTCHLNIFQRKGLSMANTKKMVIAVYGNLYIGNIDTEKLHSQGGFLVTATDEEIQEAIKDIYWLDVRVIRQDVRYENILLGDDVQLCVYATGDIQVGSRMSMMSTRSASPSLDFPAFYALQGSILNAPLNPQEVYKLLGLGKYKGTWWDIGYLNKDDHGKTNLWSKRKPMRVNKVSDLTDADRKNAYYGISVDLSAIVSKVYSIAPPRGLEYDEPYRCNDFDGYNHNAPTGVTFKILEATKNIFQDSTPFTLYLEDDPDLITFYDIRHHPAFSDYTIFRFVASNVSTSNYIIKEMPITANPLFIELSNSDLSNLGNGYVRIRAEIANSSITNTKVLPKDCVLEVTTDVGILFDLSDLYIGTLNSNLKPIVNYKPGVGGALNLDPNADLAFGTFGVENNSGVTISQSNIFLIFRYTDADGNKVYKRCPVFSNVDSGANQTRPWTLESGSGRYYLKPIIASKDIPLIKASGNVTAVSLAFQFKTTKNGKEAYFDFTSSIDVNLIRSAGTEPIPV